MKLVIKQFIYCRIESKIMRAALLLILCSSVTLHATVFSQSAAAGKGENASPENAVLRTGMSPGELLQGITVRGTVTDKGQPMPGVNVVIKGGSTGVVTDIDGKYTIPVPDKEAVLTFSFIGFVTQEIRVGDQRTIDISLDEETMEMEEVVVVGYGTRKKRDLTGAIASIGSKDIENAPANNLLSAMQGKAAGVQITSSSGAPGDGITVRVRGMSSLNLGNDPLYVVDGVPIETTSTSMLNVSEQHGLSPLAYLNPGDIESVEILKDAASSSIYGSRAANGVVLITTKKGKEGKARIDVSATMGISNITRKLSVLNREQYRNLIIEGYVNEDAYNNRAQSDYNYTIADPFNPVNMGDNDWQSVMYRQAVEKQVNLSVAGGTKTLKYAFTGSYLDQDGILLGSKYKRFTTRANTEFSVTNFLRLGSNMSYTYSTNDRAASGGMGNQSLVVATLIRPATYAMYYPNGAYVGYINGKRNPVALAEESTFENVSNRFIGNEYVEVDLIKGLKFRTSIGLDFENMKEDLFFPTTVDYREGYNQGYVRSSNYLTIVNENYFTYNGSLGEHHLGAVVGNSQQYWKKEVTGLDGFQFASDDLRTLNGAGSITSWTPNYTTAHAIVSFFGRVSYDYKSNYLFEANLRADGSSRFGENHHFGYFPSASAAWRFTEEPFMEWAAGIVDNGKIRYSIGQTGNEAIDNYTAQGNFATGKNYLTFAGVAPEEMPNEDLVWETTTQNNIGLDISILNNRIDVTVDAYLKKTKDLLYAVPLPNTTGFASITRNIGSIENKGLELMITTHNFVKDFKWNSSLNLSFNRNKVLSLPDEVMTNGYITSGDFQILKEGEPIGTFFGYNNMGVYARDEDNDKQKRNLTATGKVFKGGDVNWEDIDKNGIIDAKDRSILGNAQPKFTGGFNNDFSYKGFSLNVFFQFSYGGSIYNNVAWYRTDIMSYNMVSLETYEKSWRKQGDITEYPKVIRNDPMQNLSRVQNRWLEDGSYLKLKSAVLAYNIPPSWLQKIKVSNVKIYISGNNLLTWTKYSGYDPDVSSYNDLRIGVDQGVYPQSRTFQFGINVGF